MSVLEWDNVGERLFETGIDRGVLYLPEDEAHPWNGLTGVDEEEVQELKSYYVDGIKYLDYAVPSDYVGVLRAFTYPEAFEQALGVHNHGGVGFLMHNQRPKTFGLSYRTRIGNDIDGPDHGYKVHILYNLFANPSTKTYAAIGSSVEPLAFAFDLVATPIVVAGHRPTAHITLDSTKMAPELLSLIEDKLYGTSVTDAYLPPLSELLDMVNTSVIIEITDNGDGTWTVTGPDDHVYMTDDVTFTVDGVTVVVIDEDTYEVTTTILDEGE